MLPGILLDRDGTIIVDYHYVGHIERVQFIPGAIEAIRRFNQASIPVAVVTNQSGVARGFYPEDNVIEVHSYIQRELALHGAHIDLFLYSPSHPDAFVSKYAHASNDHKPNAGMAYKAARSLWIDLSQSVVVGDRPEDIELADRIGAHAVYLGATPTSRPHVKFDSLADAAGYIIERLTGMSQSEFPTMHYDGMGGYFTHYADEVKDILDRMTIQTGPISQISETLFSAYNFGGKVYVAGNGGAAAIANHFETDHMIQMGYDSMTWEPRIYSLASNTSVITAAANDIGYDSIFSYQLEHNATTHDVLIVFSVSGNSPNIVRALQCASEIGMETIAIIACDGGKAAGMADKTIHIPTSNYGIAEDIMQMIMHALAQFIRQSKMTDEQIQSARF